MTLTMTVGVPGRSIASLPTRPPGGEVGMAPSPVVSLLSVRTDQWGRWDVAVYLHVLLENSEVFGGLEMLSA